MLNILYILYIMYFGLLFYMAVVNLPVIHLYGALLHYFMAHGQGHSYHQEEGSSRLAHS